MDTTRPGPAYPPARDGAPARVVAVSPSGGRGGAETMLFRGVTAAARAGHEVVCLVPDGPLNDDLRAAGIRVRQVPTARLPAGSRASAAGALGTAVVRVALALRCELRPGDVVLANGLLTLPSLRLLPRIGPRVWWAHDVVVRGDRLRLARACGPAVDTVVGVSHAVLAPLTGVGRRQVVVRNGVDLPADRADPAPQPIVGCTAALTPWKGQDVLLEAFARLRAPDARLELLGAVQPKDEPFEEALRARAARPDLSGRVAFLGHVPDPLPVMRRWTVGVSASVDAEASGLGVLEAMSLGLPQVVTDGGGPAEVVGDAAVVVPARDPAAMADALARLLDDHALWQRCSVAGPQVVAVHAHRPVQEAALLEALLPVPPG